jgi:2-oxoglutarate ferredoxin oxidoreductase subunit delta
MKNGTPKFDYTLCIPCGICVQACPFGCLDLSKTDLDRYRKAYPQLLKPDDCTGCKICEVQCPVECIRVS